MGVDDTERKCSGEMGRSDEMNIHVVQSISAMAEGEEQMAASRKIISSQNNSPVQGIIQDAAVGIYILTNIWRTGERHTMVDREVFMDCVDKTNIPLDRYNDLIKRAWWVYHRNLKKEKNKERIKLYREFIQYITYDNEKNTYTLADSIPGKLMCSIFFPPIFCYQRQSNTNEEYPLVEIEHGIILPHSGPLSKGECKHIIHFLWKEYSVKIASLFLTEVQRLIYYWFPHHGFSIGLSDCMPTSKNEITQILAETMAGIQPYLGKNDVESEAEIVNILNSAMNKGATIAKQIINKDDRNALHIMQKSGAKGSLINQLQIMAFVGLQNIGGQRIPCSLSNGSRALPHFAPYDNSPEARGFVNNSYVDGLTPSENFFHAASGRQGVISTAIKSVTGDTPLIIIENGVSRRVLIGEWIDELIENSSNVEYYPKDNNLQMLKVQNTYIPTLDSYGRTSWGELTAVTRHDPSPVLYKVKTDSGREITVAESKSLLVWNGDQFLPKNSPDVVVGDYVPMTCYLPKFSTSIQNVNVCSYLFGNLDYTLELDYDSGIVIGSYIANGIIVDNYISVLISENAIKWFDKHHIDYEIYTIDHNTFIRGKKDELAYIMIKYCGSYVKQIPEWAFTATDDFVKGLIKGYVSSGLCTVNKGISITSTNESIVESISILLLRYNIFGNRSQTNSVHELSVNGYYANRFIKVFGLHTAQLDITENFLKSTRFDCVLDKIVSIQLVKPIDPFLYDVTVPGTFNFIAGNGVGLADTADSGYIQKRIGRKLEDLSMVMDGTVRDAYGNIIQFIYGDDGLDPQKLYRSPGLKFPFFVNVRSLAWKINASAVRQEQVSDKDKPRHLKDNEIDFFLSRYIQAGAPGLQNEVTEQVTKNIHSILRSVLVKEKIYECKIPDYFYEIRHFLETSKSKYGELVGMIASSSIGEPTTQLVLNSVEWNTEFIILSDSVPTRLRIGKWVDDLLTRYHKDIIHYKENRTEYLELRNEVLVPTVSSSGKTSWGKVTAITRHLPVGKLVKVKTRSGREVIASRSKSFLVWTGKKFKQIPGSKIQIGDQVPVTMKMQNVSTIHQLLLSKYLPKNEWIYGTDLHLAVEVQKKEKGRSGWWSKHNGDTFTLPYKRSDTAMTTLKRTKSTVIEPGFVYPLYCRAVKSRVPDKFFLTEDFGFIVGIYIAEGWVTNTFTGVSNNEKYILDRVQKWSDSLNVTYHFVSKDCCDRLENGRSNSIILHSVLIARWFRSWIGTGCEGKRVPLEAYNGPMEFAKGVLDGYFSGDGTVDKKGVYLCMTSASRSLIEDISVLCSRFSIFGQMSSPQPTHNNIGSKKIRRVHVLSIRNIWKDVWRDNIGSTHLPKLKRMFNTNRNGYGRLYAPVQDVVLDKIVSVEDYISDYGCVYDLTVPSTTNFCIYNGLGMADTFHLAGVGGKDVNIGVPRFNEILNTTKSDKQKKPSCTIHLNNPILKENSAKVRKLTEDNQKLKESNKKYLKNSEEIQKLKEESLSIINETKKEFEEISVGKLLNGRWKMYYVEEDVDPKTGVSPVNIIPYEKYSPSWWASLCRAMGESFDIEPNNWVVILEFDTEELFRKRITLRDIADALEIEAENNIFCAISPECIGQIEVYFDFDNIKQYVHDKSKNKPDEDICDGNLVTDENVNFFTCREAMVNYINETHISGIPNIDKVYPREDPESKEWVLDTKGNNFRKILESPLIDSVRTTVDDMWAIYETLGIMAARRFLIKELIRIISFDGVYIDIRHIQLLADRMTHTGVITGVRRDGIDRDMVGPIAKLLFEKQVEMAALASVFTETDALKSVSSSVMYGTDACVGTAAVIVQDPDKIPVKPIPLLGRKKKSKIVK